MLNPYICVACEKVIQEQPTEIDQSSRGVSSLISLFSKLVLQLPADAAEIPENAVVPKEWAIYSEWDNEAGDENKKYILCTEVLYPNGNPFGDVKRLHLPVEPKRRSQMIIRVQGFPIGQTGFYTVRTWIEADGHLEGTPIQFQLELVIKTSTRRTSTSIDS